MAQRQNQNTGRTPVLPKWAKWVIFGFVVVVIIVIAVLVGVARHKSATSGPVPSVTPYTGTSVAATAVTKVTRAPTEVQPTATVVSEVVYNDDTGCGAAWEVDSSIFDGTPFKNQKDWRRAVTGKGRQDTLCVRVMEGMPGIFDRMSVDDSLVSVVVDYPDGEVVDVTDAFEMMVVTPATMRALAEKDTAAVLYMLDSGSTAYEQLPQLVRSVNLGYLPKGTVVRITARDTLGTNVGATVVLTQDSSEVTRHIAADGAIRATAAEQATYVMSEDRADQIVAQYPEIFDEQEEDVSVQGATKPESNAGVAAATPTPTTEVVGKDADAPTPTPTTELAAQSTPVVSKVIPQGEAVDFDPADHGFTDVKRLTSTNVQINFAGTGEGSALLAVYLTKDMANLHVSRCWGDYKIDSAYILVNDDGAYSKVDFLDALGMTTIDTVFLAALESGNVANLKVDRGVLYSEMPTRGYNMEDGELLDQSVYPVRLGDYLPEGSCIVLRVTHPGNNAGGGIVFSNTAFQSAVDTSGDPIYQQ